MQFDADALKYLKAEFAEPTHRPDQEPSGVYLARKADGSYERWIAAPRHRSYVAHSVQGLAALAILMTENGTKPVEIFIGHNTAVAVPDERTDRRDRATLLLKRSPEFLALEQDKLRNKDHGEFVLTLATTLRGCPQDAGFLPLVRDLKFRSDDQGHSRVAHAGGSMGRAVELEVAGREGGSLPETVVLYVPVFEGLQTVTDLFFAHVECALVVDAGARKFSLFPLPGEIAKALADASADIERALVERDLPEGIRINSDAEFVLA